MSLLEILPLALVMVAGPQIISAFFLATTLNWARNSAAFLGGAAVSITTVVTIAYLVAWGTKRAAGPAHAGTADRIIDWVVLALMLFLIVYVYLNRKRGKTPKWMTRLEQAEPKFAFSLGLVLLGVFPSDIVTSIAAGLHVGRHGDPWWQCLPFVALTLLLLAVPVIAVTLLGKRADAILPKISGWMTQHGWIVNEIVLAFFAVITINGLVSGS
jgi:hypothetical protein